MYCVASESCPIILLIRNFYFVCKYQNVKRNVSPAGALFFLLRPRGRVRLGPYWINDANIQTLLITAAAALHPPHAKQNGSTHITYMA